MKTTHQQAKFIKIHYKINMRSFLYAIDFSTPGYRARFPYIMFASQKWHMIELIGTMYHEHYLRTP